ncbi:hypothetical protein [Plantactinospora sp. B5E13]|uniref:hypothetical protein n=1 Tax=Plantactinospora sp. B5E13 TaxID=3153758 RepID=UPI00325EBF74
MESTDRRAAEPTNAEPQQFMPLPGGTGADQSALVRSMAELVELLGGEPLPDSATSKEWRVRAWQTMRATVDQPPREDWFGPLIRAAVHEPDPSFSERFVKPALSWFGIVRVQTALIEHLRSGTNQERAGAARAWYWSHLPRRRYAGPYTPDAKSGEEGALMELRQQWRETALREFVANDNLRVRQCILPVLTLNPARHRPELRDLVAEAVQIARTSSDEYLRHRVEVQIH